MCALPWNVAHCQQRAMAASRKNNRNIGWKNQHGDGEIKKNTSRPYHCTFQCWCNNYAKANNIWQTFKNARSQNIYTDSPHFPDQVQTLPKKNAALRPTQTHAALCFPATNVFDNMQHCNKLTNNERNQQTHTKINENVYTQCICIYTRGQNRCYKIYIYIYRNS